jgi:hypothetical protein
MGTHWKLIKMFKRKDFNVLCEDGLGEGESNEPKYKWAKYKVKNFHTKILPLLCEYFMTTSGSAFFSMAIPEG